MPLTSQRRHTLVEELNQLKLELHERGKRLHKPERVVIRARIEELEREYLTGLPSYTIARCPHCEATFDLGADFDGLKGPFWKHFGVHIVRQTCPHALAFLGALNYRGTTPSFDDCGPFNEIHSGPEVPFLVPRLMQLPGVKCVIASRTIVADRFTAYFMTYFADPPQPRKDAHQNWLRQTHAYVDDEGTRVNRMRTDPWDFHVVDWMQKAPGSVAWIGPGDESATLRWTAHDYPYAEVEGRRAPLVVAEGKVTVWQVPDGEPIDRDT